MGAPEHEMMTVDAFLAWVAHRDERYELVGGRPIRLMTGAKQAHNVVTSNIVVALAPRAKAGGCRTTSSDTAVRTGPNGVRYPDVVVDCGPRDPSALAAIQPTVVVEVSSPGTSMIDVSDKLDEYRRHRDIRVIMLVDPDTVSVKVYRRITTDAWDWASEKYETLDDVVRLPEIGADLALSEIYDTLEPDVKPRLRIVAEEPQTRLP